MAAKSFSKKEALSYGWQTFKKNWQFLLIVVFITAVINIVPSYIIKIIFKDSEPLQAILNILMWFVQAIIEIGLLIISLKFVDGKKPELSDLYSYYRLFPKYLLSSIIFGLIFIVGLILLIVPGIIFATKYQYFSYLIIDKGLGPWEAIKKSGQITQGHKWNLFLLGLINAGLSFLGLLAFGVGIFVVAPVISLACAYVYRKLSPKA